MRYTLTRSLASCSAFTCGLLEHVPDTGQHERQQHCVGRADDRDHGAGEVVGLLARVCGRSARHRKQKANSSGDTGDDDEDIDQHKNWPRKGGDSLHRFGGGGKNGRKRKADATVHWLRPPNAFCYCYRFSFLAWQATTTLVGSMASSSNCISITLPFLSIR